MNNRKSQIANRKSAGFTLIELLVVIGIIVILVGILLPVANKVRVAAQRTATIGTISRISQGCEAYYSVFGAYPGTFGNSTVLPTAAAIPVTFANYPTTGGMSAPTTPVNLTSTENMALSLLGGLSVINPAPYTLGYDFNTIGQDGASLNTNKPGKNQAFMEVRPQELTTSTGNERYNGQNLSAGQWMGPYVAPEESRPVDSAFPEILDNFSSPHPILYMRAAKGNSSFINIVTPPNPTDAQYDVRELAAYGFPQTNASKPDPNGTKTISDYYPATGLLTAGLGAYFGNSELTTDANNPVPIHKDQYILISAGPDGLFGTADDIRN